MWTAQNRRRYDRSQLRYPSDLTDEEWAHVAPLIPPARRGGNKRHGIQQFSPGLLAVHKKLKRAFDPHGILGPGRIHADF